MKRLTKEIAKQAEQNGICKDWLCELKSLERVEDFANMYLKGIDFCLSNDFPTNDFLRDNFKGKMERHGIYLDDALSVSNQPKTVALGDCCGTVSASEYHVAEVFVKHGSELTINASDHSFMVVDVFDNATVWLNVRGKARVAVNRYGSATVNVLGVGPDAYLKINRKNKKTY